MTEPCPFCHMKWTLCSERNPPRKGYYAIRYRGKGTKNPQILTARYRKGIWEIPKGYITEHIIAWCEFPAVTYLSSTQPGEDHGHRPKLAGGV